MSVTQIGLTPREVIDPDGTLPEVTFRVDPSEKMQNSVEPGVTRYVVDSGDQTVGFAEIRGDELHTTEMFDGVGVDDKYRAPGAKRGFGVAIYLEAIERAHRKGKVFSTSNRTLTSHAVEAWNRFVDVGIAEVVEPFVLTQKREPQFSDIYKGRVVIRPPENIK